MFVVKRVFLCNKRLAYHICTSAVNKCDKNDRETKFMENEEKEEKNFVKKPMKQKNKLFEEKVVSPEEKREAEKDLKSLLEDLIVEEKTAKEVTEEIHLEKMLEPETKRRKSQRSFSILKLLDEAASVVSEDLGGDTKKTKEDLLEHLKHIEVSKDEPKEFEEIAKPKPTINMSEVVLSQKDAIQALILALNTSTNLNIFRKTKEKTKSVKLLIWDQLEEEELAYRALKPPRNQFEEWIMWTNQGKLWHFPIDNDQGMEKEAEINFTQHVFLDEHLEPWCPKQGPLRKFMNLVLIGLSKNPYLSLEDKKEHIFWYRDYFEKKKQLLQELGAFGTVKEIEEAKKPEENP